MKEIKIVWLYGDLLDLYGDSGNIRVLEYFFKKENIKYQIKQLSIYDELDFKDTDFIYCGPGKLKNILVANEHFKKYADKFKQAINNNTTILFTGNAYMLLGKEIIDINNNKYQSSNLYDYSVIDVNKITIKDVVSTTSLLQKPVYGFINRTYQYQTCNIENNLFTVTKGLSEKSEGFYDHNLFVTNQLGPILVKNPELCSFIFEKITKQKLDLENSLMETAYEKTMEELK